MHLVLQTTNTITNLSLFFSVYLLLASIPFFVGWLLFVLFNNLLNYSKPFEIPIWKRIQNAQPKNKFLLIAVPLFIALLLFFTVIPDVNINYKDEVRTQIVILSTDLNKPLETTLSHITKIQLPVDINFKLSPGFLMMPLTDLNYSDRYSLLTGTCYGLSTKDPQVKIVDTNRHSCGVTKGMFSRALLTQEALNINIFEEPIKKINTVQNAFTPRFFIESTKTNYGYVGFLTYRDGLASVTLNGTEVHWKFDMPSNCFILNCQATQENNSTRVIGLPCQIENNTIQFTTNPKNYPDLTAVGKIDFNIIC
jgi:hypothetical protein